MTSHARAYHGLGSVSANNALSEAAAAKAQDIADCGFSHTACGRAFDYWIDNKGYSGNCYAENIAQGQANPGAVFVAWMNSPGHKTNILGSNYVHLGVAGLPNGGGTIWVMLLGGC
jgi:uncharacterized protein YkwD